MKVRSVRTIWISDIHLRTEICKAELLADFLWKHSAQHLYLLGDIVDSWNSRNHKLDPHQEAVVKLLLNKQRYAHVIYIDGNHDKYQENKHLLTSILPVPIIQRTSYLTLKNKKLLLIHGHQFDRLQFVSNMSLYRWLYVLATKKIRPVLPGQLANLCLSASLAGFSWRATQYAKEQGYDGVITGHTHQPQMLTTVHGTYYNDGDWVYNCTALIEDFDGTISLVHCI